MVLRVPTAPWVLGSLRRVWGARERSPEAMHKPGAAPSPPGHPPPRLPLCYLVGNRTNNFVKGNKIGLEAVKRDWLQGPGGMSKGPSPQFSPVEYDRGTGAAGLSLRMSPAPQGSARQACRGPSLPSSPQRPQGIPLRSGAFALIAHVGAQQGLECQQASGPVCSRPAPSCPASSMCCSVTSCVCDTCCSGWPGL